MDVMYCSKEYLNLCRTMVKPSERCLYERDVALLSKSEVYKIMDILIKYKLDNNVLKLCHLFCFLIGEMLIH